MPAGGTATTVPWATADGMREEFTPVQGATVNRWLAGCGLAVLWVAGLTCAARAEDPGKTDPDLNGGLLLPRSLFLPEWEGRTTPDASEAPRGARFPLFRMPTGYISDPLGIADDDTLNGSDDGPASGDNVGSPNSRWSVSLGPDNPYFDMRPPGDPGGVGYYKLDCQCQLIGQPVSGLNFALQAATPAGLDSDGVAGGPTILRPALAYYHELTDGTAIQGFVGKTLAARPQWSDNLERSVRYGVAFQSAVPGMAEPTGQGVHLFVEALGHSRFVADTAARPPASLEVLPGLHWQLRDNWWMSGGMIVPVGPARQETGLWQFTCSWRF